MREQIFIRINPANPDEASWICQSGSKSGQYAELMRGQLAEIAPFATGKRIILLIPSTWVTFSNVNVPTRNRQRLAAAVPNLLEDQLASDIDTLHFALGKREPNGDIAVAMIDLDVLRDCMTKFAQCAIHPHVVVPEVLALPYTPGSWTVLIEQDTAILRTGLQSGLALDRDNLPFLLHRVLDEAGTSIPGELLVVTGEDIELDEVLAGDPPLNCRLLESREPALKQFATYFNEKDVINLLQGGFSIRDQLGKMWRPWRAAGIMLVCWLILQAGLTSAKQFELSRERKALSEEINNIYLRTFPEAQKVVNAKVQMQRGIDALRSGESGAGDTSRFLEILAGLSAPIVETQGLSLQRVSYKEGEVSLALAVGDLQKLEQFKERLTSSGHQVEILSANTSNNQVDARVQVKKGKP